MIFLDIALIFFLLLTVTNYRVQRSVLYPPFIFSGMWLLDLIVYRSGLLEIDPVHGKTLFILAFGALAFSIGGWLAILTPTRILRTHLFLPERKPQPSFIRNLLVLILICGLPVLFYQVFQLGRGGSGISFLMRARAAQVDAMQNGQQIHSFFLDYFLTIAIFISFAFATEKRDRRFWIATGVAFFGCILSTGRTSLLVLIGGLSAIRLLQAHRESFSQSLKLLRWPVLLFITLYIALIFINKNTEGLVGGASGIAVYFVLSYIAGPLAAFDRVVQRPFDFVPVGSHVFEFPLKLAGALHLTNYIPPPRFDEFILVPFPTNVYTVYKFYFLELGIGGMLCIMLIVGFFHSLLYLKARQGGKFSTYMFAFSFYSVLMVIFDDAYSSAGGYLRAFIFGWLYFTAVSVPLRLHLFPSRKQPSHRSSSSASLAGCSDETSEAL
ncbi:O-antigen polymerase [Paracidobacterium acidisoli]|uniref:Oligosaccharide repeat unit polymerase n=1 Tax=Paracidobacterium acidisoli TaxID=2303751 RepID=A0A372IQ79_9BACT|nr:O-antigen polymerase [Paracidobacterium acidisoli]MBT9331243.1 oligosaccharide repeat unit polymerase [Paracidobacterium acidisoli]